MTVYFSDRVPLLAQFQGAGLQFDQQLQRALEISASRPDLEPEDSGFPDSYLTLALYRLNSILTRVVELDESPLNLFHDYKKAPPCRTDEVVPGRRLCSVLTEAAKEASDGVIGVGHFIRAIVGMSLDQDAWDYNGSAIHDTFSVETLLWGTGHNAWTHLKDAPEVVDALNSLGEREQIQDHQYLLMTDSGRIVFRPLSILDPYTMEEAGSRKDRLSLLPHFDDAYSSFSVATILELESLINHPKAREADLQKFFELHPHLLRMWEYRDVYPQVYLAREDDGPLVPDFLLVDPDLQKAMIVDLKLPTKRVVIGSKNRRRLSAPVQEAVAQVLQYQRWFEEKDHRQRLKERTGMEIYQPRLGVIIGRQEDFGSELERQRLAADSRDVEIVTYDDISKYAQRRLRLVRSAERR